MGFRRRATVDTDYLTDALEVLAGWQMDGTEIYRMLSLDDAQHADLAERIKIYSDALQVRPRIRRRDGETRIGLGSSETGELSDREVHLAARIEGAYRSIVGIA
jgi:4a-hydroxytetrahydrobiopterin dehydratase